MLIEISLVITTWGRWVPMKVEIPQPSLEQCVKVAATVQSKDTFSVECVPRVKKPESIK